MKLGPAAGRGKNPIEIAGGSGVGPKNGLAKRRRMGLDVADLFSTWGGGCWDEGRRLAWRSRRSNAPKTVPSKTGGRGEVGWVEAGWVVLEGQDLIASLSDLSTYNREPGASAGGLGCIVAQHSRTAGGSGQRRHAWEGRAYLGREIAARRQARKTRGQVWWPHMIQAGSQRLRKLLGVESTAPSGAPQLLGIVQRPGLCCCLQQSQLSRQPAQRQASICTTSRQLASAGRREFRQRATRGEDGAGAMIIQRYLGSLRSGVGAQQAHHAWPSCRACLPRERASTSWGHPQATITDSKTGGPGTALNQSRWRVYSLTGVAEEDGGAPAH